MSTTPATVSTIDQNTRREITWNVDYCAEVGPNVARLGWTHTLGLSRPKGRRIYTACATIEGGSVVRVSTPVKVF
jgi:hypothetical protein